MSTQKAAPQEKGKLVLLRILCYPSQRINQAPKTLSCLQITYYVIKYNSRIIIRPDVVAHAYNPSHRKQKAH